MEERDIFYFQLTNTNSAIEFRRVGGFRGEGGGVILFWVRLGALVAGVGKEREIQRRDAECAEEAQRREETEKRAGLKDQRYI
jgi:hypothetical protein